MSDTSEIPYNSNIAKCAVCGARIVAVPAIIGWRLDCPNGCFNKMPPADTAKDAQQIDYLRRQLSEAQEQLAIYIEGIRKIDQAEQIRIIGDGTRQDYEGSRVNTLCYELLLAITHDKPIVTKGGI